MQIHLNWGILGTGLIAAKFARDLPRSRTGRLVAVGSRTAAAASAFAKEHGAPVAHASYEDLLSDPRVDAVYVATPHPQHLQWARLALERGKQVLCEKPLTMNRQQAAELIEVARQSRRTLMEAFMYRCHPQTRRIIDIVQGGEIGRIELMQASFSYHTPYDPNSRAWSPSLGGGGILDVGVYPVSMARLVAGAISDKAFLNPSNLVASGRLSPDGVDAHATALLTFDNQFVAQISCGVGLEQDNRMRLYGTKGWLEIPAPWVPSASAPSYSIIRHTSSCDKGIVEEAQIDRPLYALEADAFANAVASGSLEVPEMSWSDTLGNLEVTDAWLAAVGVRYPSPAPLS